MNRERLKVIQKLRQERENRGQIHLLSSRQALEDSIKTLEAAERAEHIQSVMRKAQETQLYRDLRGKPVSSDDIDRLNYQLDKHKQTAEILHSEVKEAETKKNNAKVKVEDAQKELTRLYRSRMKWDELKSVVDSNEIAIAEQTEEIVLEDTFIMKPTATSK